MKPSRTLVVQRGTTLVEAAAVIAIIAVVAGLAAPAFGPTIERRHIEGAAAQLETDLQLARATAVAHNKGVRFSFQAPADGSTCYVLHTGGSGDCGCAPDGQPSCKLGSESFRAAHFASGGPVRIVSNSPSLQFHPVLGTVTPTATAKVQGPSGAAIHLVVNVMGRIRSCSPAPAIPGHPAC